MCRDGHAAPALSPQSPQQLFVGGRLCERHVVFALTRRVDCVAALLDNRGLAMPRGESRLGAAARAAPASQDAAVAASLTQAIYARVSGGFCGRMQHANQRLRIPSGRVEGVFRRSTSTMRQAIQRARASSLAEHISITPQQDCSVSKQQASFPTPARLARPGSWLAG